MHNRRIALTENARKPRGHKTKPASSAPIKAADDGTLQ
jgi:hypothetical protein